MTSRHAFLAAVASAAGVASILLVLVSSSSAQGDPSRVIDRTFSCALASPTVNVHGRAGVRNEGTTRWRWLAYASAYTNQDVLVWMSAGAPKPAPTELYAQDQTLGVNALVCKPRRASVPLVPRGLAQGGNADVFGDTYDCFAPRTILLRVRAAFFGPTALHVRSGTSQGRRWSVLQTTVAVRDGRFVIATPAGKRIAYGDVRKSGRARVFVAAGCIPD